MKKVTDKVWKQKAAGLAEWRKKRTTKPSLDVYKRIVDMVHVGESVADIGAGQCYLWECLPDHVEYYDPYDPFPLNKHIRKAAAEDLTIPELKGYYHTVFMLAALDNVKDVEQSLRGLRHIAIENIVILTGIGIVPDQYHTHQIDREDLVDVLGEPTQEIEIGPKLFLFEWRFK